MDSPLLALLSLTAGLHWQDVADGGRMLAAFLQQHGSAALPPPPTAGCEQLSLLLPEAAAPAGKATAPAQTAPSASLAALPGPLAAFLASNGIPLPAAGTVQPTGSSSSSEDACDLQVEESDGGGASAGPPAAAGPAVSSGSSLASDGTSRVPKGGLGLPPRASKAKARS